MYKKFLVKNPIYNAINNISYLLLLLDISIKNTILRGSYIIRVHCWSWRKLLSTVWTTVDSYTKINVVFAIRVSKSSNPNKFMVNKRHYRYFTYYFRNQNGAHSDWCNKLIVAIFCWGTILLIRNGLLVVI